MATKKQAEIIEQMKQKITELEVERKGAGRSIMWWRSHVISISMSTSDRDSDVVKGEIVQSRGRERARLTECE